ncbi:MAG: (Fe-S)-binding protein [bacterium]
MMGRFDDSELLSIYDEVAKCNRCGWCQSVCPIYLATGFEASVARGRNTLIRNIIEGKIDLGREMESPIFECLLCKACVSNCFPAIKTHENIVAARRAYVERHGQSPILRYIFRKLLLDTEKMASHIRLLGFAKRSGASKLAKGLEVLGWFGRNLYRAQDIIQRIPREFLRDRLGSISSEPRNNRGNLAYFLGCAINFALPNVGESTFKNLVGLGYKVISPENVCCGLPPYTYGDVEAAKNLARRNIEIFRNLEVDNIITECGSCSSFLKEYPKLFAGNTELARTAEEFAGKVVDLNEFLTSSNLPSRAELKPLSGVVTYHDPCHLSRYQNLRSQPREILKSIPGIEYREMDEADWCCGGAGSYNVAHYELSMRVLDRKMGNIERTGAGIVATSCPACIIQISYGARRRKMNLEVVHISELVNRARAEG